ncbi:DUF3040 domain-containing protein [Nocardiopsis sp. RSe5-2]|uniref:DUF3040 domain-containing protein n=1 Tax=Nocardiopsis endophytica TaxID=3018445 RepID=A0ABT4U2X6_9ACTN|nr:DUF3040 domain-containing protein [Nocardiopsis endophytica]MDA2811285.1 DUF3040 domain-containing protein [Nocardiopsis endophytica]
MALREYEERILAAIEHRLTEDDPVLAGRLQSFGECDPGLSDAPADGDVRWRAWLVCAIVGSMVLLVMLALILLAPPAEAPSGEMAPEQEQVDRTGDGQDTTATAMDRPSV